MSAQLKLSSFYGAGIARPYVVFDAEGAPVKERVNQPRVNDALVEWGAKVPFESGGLLVRPKEWQGHVPSKARREFAIFEEERRGDILASNPILLSGGDAQEFHMAAAEFWRDELTAAERQSYVDRAKAERAAARDAAARLAETDPAYAKHAAAEAKYKSARSAIVSAARAAAGPLWRLQRRADAAARDEPPAELPAATTLPSGAAKRGRAAATKIRAVVKKRPAKKIPIRSKKHRAMHAARAAAAVAAEAAEGGAMGQSDENAEALYTGEYEMGGDDAAAAAEAEAATTRSKAGRSKAASPSRLRSRKGQPSRLETSS